MNEFERNYTFLGSMFNMPIAEVIYKDKHGMFFFSKIMVGAMYISKTGVEFILDPLEIVYIDIETNKMTQIWRKSNREMDHQQDMKSAIQEWIEVQRMPGNSIIDYGPYSQLRSLSDFTMNKEELDSYIVNPNLEGNPNLAFSLLSRIENMKVFNENKEEDAEKLKQLKATLFRARYDHVIGQMKDIKDIRKNFKNRN